ncbi:hypothetical protein C7974DRAFT_234547 [Boeremia exigua]|uniref:uncharacterized protein n=1 Tax=Boeremia exigua TaxID=749465 RepID=UPI001E8CE9FC|nr:uncharacterized protein C7974DRAFT_234547 [Boeremia exigua]KAH6620458.1 hypothetical protein C7974DRAFT_234547 [Boeremia exigua]
MSRFRNRDRSNRPGRGQIEHNVLEGLPINQYREIEVTIGPNTTDNKPVDVNAWPELPMPRDSHMLPEHSQQLLRAARSGRTIKPQAPPEDDDNEMKDEEPEHKEVSAGFIVKKYAKVARHNEAPEPEYLAKRRKGLPSQYISGQVHAPLRETKVKKLDAEGNVAIYKVLAPEGQAVEGEVAPTDAAIEVVPVIAAPGTVVEGVGVVNAEGIVVSNDVLQQTPPRRRPPPPKKKKTKHIPRPGPGRGRKRVDFVEGAEGQGTPAPAISGDVPMIRDLKSREGNSVEPSDRDTPMGEAGEEDESGEEGSEDDEQDQEDGTPATPSKALPISAPVVEMTDAPDVATPEIVLPAIATPEVAAPEVIAPTESAPVVETSTDVPSKSPQPLPEADPETEQPVPASVTEPVVSTAIRERSSSPGLPLSTANHSRQNSTSELATSATTMEPIIPELAASEPVPAPVPSTETESVHASVDVPTGEPAEASVSVPEQETSEIPSQKEPSAPPSENTPDLLGSLEAELNKE